MPPSTAADWKLACRKKRQHGGFLAAACLAAATSGAWAQEAAQLGPSALKQLSIEQLLNVEVTSVSRTPERLFDAPAAIQVVSNSDMQNSGATSIPEALRLATNLQVAQENSHDWAISARGFNANLANKLLVLVDGRAVYTPLYGGVLWNVQDYPLEDLDRIEVISGPAGTQWGANAVNGVINIVSKSAQDTQGLFVSEAAGAGVLEDQTEVRYGGTLQPGIFYRAYAEYSARDGEKQLAGPSSDDGWKMARTGFRVDATPDGPKSFTLQGDLYQGTEYLGASGDEGVWGGNVLGRWSLDRGPDGAMGMTAYYDRTHLSLPYPAVAGSAFSTGFPASALVDDLSTVDVDFQDRIGSEAGSHVLVGGSYRYTLETDRDLNLVRFIPERETNDLFTGFADVQHAFSPDLRVNAGTKIEHNDFTGWEFEPSIRGSWNLGRREMLWAAVSRAVRTPARYDRDLFLPTGLINAPPGLVFPTTFLEGEKDFRSETVLAYELGWRAQLSPDFTTSVSTYLNEYDHLRGVAATPATAASPFPFPDIFENSQRAETYGAEVEASWQASAWLRLRAGYDYLHERISAIPGHVDATGGRGETGDPRNQVFLRAEARLSSHCDFSVEGRWVSKLLILDSPTSGPVFGTVPAYGDADARLAWKSGRMEYSLVGQNLLHRDHAEYGYPAAASTTLIRRAGYARIVYRY